MTLIELASFAEIISSATIVSGAIFGLYQLTELRKQRPKAVA